MSALHLTARRQTGRTHVCTGITESVASKYIILSLPLSRSLSFTLSRYHTAHNHSMFSASASLFSFPPISPPLLLLVIIYNNYELLPIQSFHLFLLSLFFFSSFRPSFIEKKIEKDFVVAASKCNEMLSLPSIHKFVLHFEFFFCFVLYWTLPILYRTELSSAI